MSFLASGFAEVKDLELQKFRQQIRARTGELNWEDSHFSSLAKKLYDSFRAPTAGELVENARALAPYLELVRQDWGLEALKNSVLRLSAQGAPPRTLAVAAKASCRAGRAYVLAVEVAYELWRRHSHDEVVSVVYAQALAATGRWEELDQLALEVQGTLNLSPWAVNEWARILLDSCRFERSKEFGRQLPEGSKSRKLFDLRVGSFDFSQRGSPFPYQTILINLDRETRKWHLAEQLLPYAGYTAERFSAVDGRELPGFALSRLGATPEVLSRHGAGAIATALSHISVWEKFLASGEDHCLVLEDDASPFIHWSFHEKVLAENKNVELLWANERMSHALGEGEIPGSSTSSIKEVLESRPAGFSGIGTDSYLITRKGAEKLLELFDQHGIYGHVDGQMGAYVARASDHTTTSKSYAASLKLRREFPPFKNVHSVCLSIPLIMANDHGSSNTVDISRDKRISLSRLGS